MLYMTTPSALAPTPPSVIACKPLENVKNENENGKWKRISNVLPRRPVLSANKAPHMYFFALLILLFLVSALKQFCLFYFYFAFFLFVFFFFFFGYSFKEFQYFFYFFE